LPVGVGDALKVVCEIECPGGQIGGLTEAASEGKVRVFEFVAVRLDRDEDAGLEQRPEQGTAEIAVIALRRHLFNAQRLVVDLSELVRSVVVLVIWIYILLHLLGMRVGPGVGIPDSLRVGGFPQRILDLTEPLSG